MKIYLARHGDAVPQQIHGTDAARPLSEKGKQDIRRLAQYLSTQDIQVEQLFHSGKLRAQQTAELLAKGIPFRGNIEVLPALLPLHSLAPLISEIETLNKSTLFVGHLPFMERLVGKLVNGDEAQTPVSFSPGTIVCLEKQASFIWDIQWVLSPEKIT